MLIDCHSHLANYNEDEISGIISRSQKSGVSYIFSAGTDIENSKKTIHLANSNDEIYCGVGIHPNRVTEYIQDNDFYKLEQLANSSSKVITMSEMGMDYMPNAPQRKIQENVFIAQISIAKKLKLPIIWHSQIPEINSFGNHINTINILNNEHAYTVGGIMHYFQADYKTATKAIENGFLISFAKPLLRQKHQKEIVEMVTFTYWKKHYGNKSSFVTISQLFWAFFKLYFDIVEGKNPPHKKHIQSVVDNTNLTRSKNIFEVISRDKFQEIIEHSYNEFEKDQRDSKTKS